MTIKEMRKKRGISQVELSKLSGINLRSLQDYEQGHKDIVSAKGETIYRLSRVLGYSMEDILAETLESTDTRGRSEEGMAERVIAYENALIKRKEKVVHFPIITADNRVDMSRIYPTKQSMVKSVIDQLRGDDRINSARLFGSSITMCCNKNSDLDFAVELKENTDVIKNDISEKIQICCEWGADILWMDRLSPQDRIYRDIMNGLVII